MTAASADGGAVTGKAVRLVRKTAITFFPRRRKKYVIAVPGVRMDWIIPALATA